MRYGASSNVQIFNFHRQSEKLSKFCKQTLAAEIDPPPKKLTDFRFMWESMGHDVLIRFIYRTWISYYEPIFSSSSNLETVYHPVPQAVSHFSIEMDSILPWEVLEHALSYSHQNLKCTTTWAHVENKISSMFMWKSVICILLGHRHVLYGSLVNQWLPPSVIDGVEVKSKQFAPFLQPQPTITINPHRKCHINR